MDDASEAETERLPQNYLAGFGLNPGTTAQKSWFGRQPRLLGGICQIGGKLAAAVGG